MPRCGEIDADAREGAAVPYPEGLPITSSRKVRPTQFDRGPRVRRISVCNGWIAPGR
jgi:hypothetical protein